MSKFRERRVVVDAVQWTGENKGEVEAFVPADKLTWAANEPVIGNQPAAVGDFIIKGMLGEFSTCKPDVFAATFEPIELFDRWPHVGKP